MALTKRQSRIHALMEAEVRSIIASFIDEVVKEKGIRSSYDNLTDIECTLKVTVCDLPSEYTYIYIITCGYCGMLVSETYIRKHWEEHTIEHKTIRDVHGALASVRGFLYHPPVQGRIIIDYDETPEDHNDETWDCEPDDYNEEDL